jgi:penicillin-binding protein 2
MTLFPLSPEPKRTRNGRTVGQKHQSIFIMLLVSILFLGGIATRLAYLQLIEGQKYLNLANNNRIRLIPKKPVRGNIFDRKGKILATSKLSHSAYVWPFAQTQPNWTKTRDLLGHILGMKGSEIDELLKKAGEDSPTVVRIARNLTPAQITALEEYRSELEWIEVYIEPIRDYPNGQVAAHVLGYTGEINEKELAQRKSEGYRLGDVVGKMGIERYFEDELKGDWGGQQVEVNGQGKIVRLLGEKPAQAGENLNLTIDIDLQKSAEKILGGRRKSAIVAMDPKTGEILALASSPTFDPNIFSSRISQATWDQINSYGNPFVNRALQGFPPASTFKIVTATAGMETGKYPPGTYLGTFPYLSAAGVRFYEWNKAGFGTLGYVGALAWSSNTFFGQIGKGVGGENLIDWSRRYGFGSLTGIELEEENSGLIADAQWKKKQLDLDWTVGDTINMSIGQGFTLATPVQVAVMFAVPANGGYKVKPHLLKEGDPSQWKTSLNMKPETINTIDRGLRAVVASGTGTKLQAPGLPPAAGKSGTAEAPPRLSHAWFGGFAPYNKPEIVVVAFVEHSGGGGGKVAAPMVRDLMVTYFQLKSQKFAPKENK